MLRVASECLWPHRILVVQACTTYGPRDIFLRPGKAFSVVENVAKTQLLTINCLFRISSTLQRNTLLRPAGNLCWSIWPLELSELCRPVVVSPSLFVLRIERVLYFIRQCVEPPVRFNFRWGRMKWIGACCCALVICSTARSRAFFAYSIEVPCSCRSYLWSVFSIGSLHAFWTYTSVVRLFQLFSKAVKQVGDKSLQFGPPICYFFSNLESPLCHYVCNKLWYGIENISSSHSASSQLSGEFMLLHWIHTLANLTLKETVPPQSRT